MAQEALNHGVQSLLALLQNRRDPVELRAEDASALLLHSPALVDAARNRIDREAAPSVSQDERVPDPAGDDASENEPSEDGSDAEASEEP
eukprot:CAMPEP_0119291058 /NCGR_PEP_ID=MMETSP1329-20130426/41837_1 /TAXON_ID=114041 /ORGANISM="Genus nov. species nov., Strain RCC1024" /LENGTH=89 /DNA_ID=CAMNT_0007291883 /DNA_START=56 /DNA_END=321 /DNA_ORIENTATION=-